MTDLFGCPPSDDYIDPLIEPFVRVLQKNGIETFESCQGTEGHCFKYPTIRFRGNAGTGYQVVGIALALGWPVTCLQRTWQVADCALVEGGDWLVEFRSFATEGAWANTDVSGLLSSCSG